MKKNTKLNVKGTEISLTSQKSEDYISLTDIARYKNKNEPKDVVKNWMRSRTTIEFLGLWEKLHNPNFKGVEFDSFMYEAGSNSFVLSPSKWIEATNAIGIISRAGNTGGTFAHQDIAFEFAAWVSAEFKLYLLKEFQRLKLEEAKTQSLSWNLQRTLAIESLNSIFIRQALTQSERLSKLNGIAIIQMTSLLKSKSMKLLK
ncbi:MAG: KilA-N domain-containing protein [Bacteroidota bacterium]|nr:KilA-N domain-containing protein [Bacteroidota bacterium]